MGHNHKWPLVGGTSTRRGGVAVAAGAISAAVACRVEASECLVGSPVFKTGEAVKAAWRVRFPSASATRGNAITAPTGRTVGAVMVTEMVTDIGADVVMSEGPGDYAASMWGPLSQSVQL